MKRYPGIRPFTADDQHLFKGRDEEKRDLFQLIVLNDIVVLFGKSGIGKSSLLNAGVCPQLEDRNLHPVFIRLNNTELPPEEQVFEHLQEKKYIPSDLPKGLTLWEYFQHFWFVDLGEVFTPVIVLDQFEELFTLYTPEERQVFIEQFADIVNGRVPNIVKEKVNNSNDKLNVNIDWETPPKVKFVLSIRSDYLYLLDELSADIPAILRTRFQLQMLKKDNAIQAITLPAMMAGNFASPTFEYAKPALKEIIEELGKKETDQLRSDLPDSEPEIEAFQLQLLCQHLENKIITEKLPKDFTITPDFYEGKAGIKTIIKDFYSGVISRIPKQYQDAVETLMAKKMIRNQRRIIMEESAIIADADIPKAVLDQLHEERMLRKEARTGNFYYEISHDTLVEPVLEKYVLIEERLERERIAEEKFEKQMELVVAKNNAEKERRRAHEEARLRGKAVENEMQAKERTELAIWISLVALLLAGTALFFWRNANAAKDLADIKTQEALMSRDSTQSALAFAEEKRNAADSSAVRAKRQERIAKANEILAEANAEEAKGNLVKANKRFASYLVSEAEKALENEDIRLAFRLTEFAYKYDKNNKKAIVLKDKIPNYASQFILEGYKYQISHGSQHITFSTTTGNAIIRLGSSSLPRNFENMTNDSCSYSPNEKYVTFYTKGKEDFVSILNVLKLDGISPPRTFKNSERGSYSSDGKYLTFYAEGEDEGSLTLNVLKLDDNSLRAFEKSGIESYSSDGKHLIFQTFGADEKSWTLNILKLDNNSLRTFEKSYNQNSSSDGKYLTFYTLGKEEDNWTLNILKFDNNSLRTFENGDSESYSPDGTYLTFQTKDSSILNILTLNDNSPPRTFENGNSEHYSPDGKYLTFFTGGKTKKSAALNILKLGDNSPLRTFEFVDNYSYSSDGKYLTLHVEGNYLEGEDEKKPTINVLKLDNNSPPRIFEISYSDIYYYSPDGKYLTFHTEGKDRLYDILNVLKLDDNSPPRVFENGQRDCYSSDGKYFFFHMKGKEKLTINILKLDDNSPLRSFEVSSFDSDRSPDGRYLTFHTEGKDRLYDILNVLKLDDNSSPRTFEFMSRDSYSPDGKYLTFLTLSKDGMISDLNVLKLDDNSPPLIYETSDFNKYYSSDRKYLAFYSEGNDGVFKVNLLNLKSGKIIRTIFHQYEPKLEFLNKNILLTTSTNPITKRDIYKIIDLSLGDTQQAFEYYKKNFYSPLTEKEKERYGIID